MVINDDDFARRDRLQFEERDTSTFTTPSSPGPNAPQILSPL